MNKYVALFCLSLAAASSQAVVTFNTFGPGDSTQTAGWGFGDLRDTRIANQFTSSHTGSLDFIKMKTQASTFGPGTISLYRDSGNDIGSLMTQFNVDITTAGVKTLTNTNPSIQLTAGEKYWIECSAAVGSGAYSGWFWNNQGVNGLLKFGKVLGDSASNPTSTYSVSSGRLSAFSVSVTPVPEPSTMAALGLFSAMGALRRRKAQ